MKFSLTHFFLFVPESVFVKNYRKLEKFGFHVQKKEGPSALPKLVKWYYFLTFASYAFSITANSARVAALCGSSLLVLVPLITL